MAKRQRSGSRASTRAGRRGPQARRPAEDRPVVTIRAHNGKAVIKAPVPSAPTLEVLAKEWGYILRSRTRWAGDPDLRQSFRERALKDLGRMGVPRQFIKRLASVRHVEVELHKWDVNDADANRIHEAAAEIPWEYLLSAATRGEGRFQSILITRLFRNGSPAIIPPPPKHVLFVESAPGRLRDEYEFESERARIRAAVGGDPDSTMQTSETQVVSELRRRVRTGRWDVVHVTGVDTHQAARLLPDLYDTLAGKPAIWKKIADAGRIRDGMILREANVAELPVSYEELARVLVNPAHPPNLVTLNLYHSGARIARALVNQGAHVAIGFLDEIDDELAERFFQAFYWAWCRPTASADVKDPDVKDPGVKDPDVMKAFVDAWREMEGSGLHGTAIVMWTGRSVFDPQYQKLARSEGQSAQVTETRPELLKRLELTPVGNLLQVELEIDEEVNYSLLHNDRALLRKLTLTKLVEDTLEDIMVKVELNLGAQNYPYRSTQLRLDQPQLALAPLVKIPLTATLPRSLRERVQSTVYVKVTCAQRTAFETTRRVTLIPVDEWLDDTDNNPWLPSFVLPRDPAILKIIGASRRYLVGIRDDPAAGFDGYQSVDEQATDRSAGVDAQVRAIWTALVNEFRLQYINPPPAYSAQTQRLRTPGDILESNTGTCIDLALLLASSLEYIGIYPVLVLLEGHAFAGYWRSEEAHEAFSAVQQIPADVPAVGSKVARAAAVPFVDPYGWRMTRMHYNELMSYVTSGDLVMLEATYLTSASSFAEAVEEGRANMRSRREFDSLLDIQLARTATPPVTPLPILSD